MKRRRSSDQPPNQMRLPLGDVAVDPLPEPTPTGRAAHLSGVDAPADRPESPPIPATPPPPLEPTTARLSEVVPRFLDFAAAIDRSPHTRRALRLDLSLLGRFLGDRLASDISLDDLRRYAAWLLDERKNDPRSLRRKVASIKAFFAYVRQIALRDDDPAERLVYPRLESRLPEFLEVDEEARLLVGADRPLWRAVTLMLLDCGLKRDELLALPVTDLHLDPAAPEQSYLVVRTADQARRIRGRTLRLTARLADALTQQVATGASDRVFPISVRAVNFIVETCAERAGLRKASTISPQMLRDTFALRHVRQRAADEQQRRALGATTAELATRRRQHDQEVCDLLGLVPGELNDPIARYRALLPAG
jgi:integrase/recombinase XerD